MKNEKLSIELFNISQTEADLIEVKGNGKGNSKKKSK